MSSKSDVSRRDFLARIGAAGALVPGLVGKSDPALAQAPRAATSVYVGRSAKAALKQSDFTYIGAFKLPTSGIGGDPSYGTGLAHRWVNGQLRFFAKSHGNPAPHRIYEVEAPALEPNPSGAYTARLVRTWGDIIGSNSYGMNLGLHWDEQDKRLYWTTGNMYNATDGYNPSVGYTTLDDQSGSFSTKGVWGFNSRSCKMAMGGVLAIPKWFSDLYAKDRRLAAGCGGYFSVATTGPVSMGPALTAFNPADLDNVPNRASVGNTPLVGYPFNAAAYTSPDRCRRDVDYATEFDGWKVRNGVGYWSWSDYIWQGAVWIDTPQKTGVMFFPTMSNGRTWYATSTLHAERASHWWFEYDPADFGLVAQGKKQEWEIQPKASWPVAYPEITYPMPEWRDEPKQHVVGATYDSTTQVLYIAVRKVLTVTAGPIIVYAYEVS